MRDASFPPDRVALWASNGCSRVFTAAWFDEHRTEFDRCEAFCLITVSCLSAFTYGFIAAQDLISVALELLKLIIDFGTLFLLHSITNSFLLIYVFTTRFLIFLNF